MKELFALLLKNLTKGFKNFRLFAPVRGWENLLMFQNFNDRNLGQIIYDDFRKKFKLINRKGLPFF
ncbi:MAG: hypothetical protein CM15mP58_20030 [Burkholderiaceae bacterium]|nr:MAG: hypothetical protein CM15mP58_20030 [Burkholderiaceae bacterium]